MTRPRPWLLVPVVAGVVVVWIMRPVCVALSDEQVTAFTTPIANRTDHDFYLTVFQQRDGRWFQCKTWLSRQFFF